MQLFNSYRAVSVYVRLTGQNFYCKFCIWEYFSHINTTGNKENNRNLCGEKLGLFCSFVFFFKKKPAGNINDISDS